MKTLTLTPTKRIALISAAALAASALAIGIQPAGAADNQSVTFTLSGGSLATNTAEGTTDLGGALPLLDTVTGPLSAVTVVDERGALVGDWATNADFSDFTTGDASEDETIGAEHITFTAGVIAPVVGYSPAVGTGVATTGFEEGSQTVVSAVAVGTNAGTFTPLVSIAIPDDVVAGTYTGTVTYSTS